MPDIESYLSELRSHLADLDPKRTEEIVAEARTHLESRVAQLRGGGLGPDEATAEALRAFGEPGRVAEDLVESNALHRRPTALRALSIAGAFSISFGTALALANLSSTPESWNSPSLRFLARHAGLDLQLAGFLLFTLQLLPAAYLAGLVGGRRFWWFAGTPGAFWVGFCWTVSLVYGNLQPYGTLPAQLLYALAIPASASMLLAGVGWLGARLGAARPRALARAARALGGICAVYAIGVALTALGRALDGPEAQSLAAVVAVPVALAFLAAARKDGRLSRREFILLFGGVSVAALLATGALAVLLCSLGVGMDVLGSAPLWLSVTAVEALLGLLLAARLWRADRVSVRQEGPPL